MSMEDTFEFLEFDYPINIVPQESCPATFSLHWHKYVEIIAVGEGFGEHDVCTLMCNQKEIVLQPGDICIIWPGEIHEIVNNKKKGIRIVQFPLTLLTNIIDFALFSTAFKNYHFFSFAETPELNQVMLEKIYRIFEQGKMDLRFKNVQMLIHLYELFMQVGNYLYETVKIEQNNKEDKLLRKIQIACKYIQENCEEDLTLEVVAEYAGFSPFYFSRTFKNITSYNFVEYLLIQRVKKMKILLGDNDYSVADAAKKAGFKSISTVNRVFKQYCGCSPSEYKKYRM